MKRTIDILFLLITFIYQNDSECMLCPRYINSEKHFIDFYKLHKKNYSRGLIFHISPLEWNGTNGDDLYIHIATVRNTIQTVYSPIYDTYMSTPGNTAKLRAIHINIQTAQSSPSLVGTEPTMH